MQKKFKNVFIAFLTLAMAVCLAAPTVPASAKSKKTTATATVKKVTSITETSAKVTYKVAKVKKVTYQIATNKKFTKGVKTFKVSNKNKAVTKTITGLKSNTTYYFRVKGVLKTKAEKKKYKVKWSKVKSFKTKAPAATTPTAPATTTEKQPETTPTANFKLKESEVTLIEGKSIEVSELLPDGVSYDDVAWYSSDTTKVSYEWGEIYAEHVLGDFTMTATYKGETATLTIHVKAAELILKDSKDINLVVGSKSDAEDDYLLDDDSDVRMSACTWTSSDTNILSFDEDNNFTCNAEGTVTITATYRDSTKTMTITVGKFAFSKSEVSMYENDEKSLYNVLPEGIAAKDVVWTSDNETIGKIIRDEDEDYIDIYLRSYVAGTTKIHGTYNGTTATFTLIVNEGESDF